MNRFHGLLIGKPFDAGAELAGVMLDAAGVGGNGMPGATL